MENKWKQWQTLFSWAPKSLRILTCSHDINKHCLLKRKSMTNLDNILKVRDITLLTKVHAVKAMVFPIVMYGCESWTIRLSAELWGSDWCLQTVVLEKTLDSPLYSKEIKPINPKGNQPRTFIGRIDAEAEAPVFWLPDVKIQLTGKHPDAGKDWEQAKGATED